MVHAREVELVQLHPASLLRRSIHCTAQGSSKMAAAKVVSLAIKTLAKPIAVQIKHQAHQHEGFKRLCIALAQYLHRVEMSMRLNLLNVPKPKSVKEKEKEKDTKQTEDKEKAAEEGKAENASSESSSESKSSSSRSSSWARPSTWSIFSSLSSSRHIRPLNDTKALERGAQAVSEFFLFAVACALIFAESYRGSRKRKKQRDETEDKVDQLVEIVKVLSERVAEGVPRLQNGSGAVDWDAMYQEATKRRAEAEGETEEEVTKTIRGKESIDPVTGETLPPSWEVVVHSRSDRHPQQQHDSDQLQVAVSLLLRMALRHGWLQGPEALKLGYILSGETPSTFPNGPLLPSSDVATAADASPAVLPTLSQQQNEPNDPQTPEQRSEILEAVAQARARALARQVRFDSTQNPSANPAESLSLAELMQRAGLGIQAENDSKES